LLTARNSHVNESTGPRDTQPNDMNSLSGTDEALTHTAASRRTE